jgi:hypothetical protein
MVNAVAAEQWYMQQEEHGGIWSSSRSSGSMINNATAADKQLWQPQCDCACAVAAAAASMLLMTSPLLQASVGYHDKRPGKH